MNILIAGAAGFIGTNLAIKLAGTGADHITVVDKRKAYFFMFAKPQNRAIL